MCFESRATRDSSPHCGTGVLARRFAFACSKFWRRVTGLSQNQRQRARTPVLHSIVAVNGQRPTNGERVRVSSVVQTPNSKPQTRNRDSPPAFSHLLVKSEVIGALRVEERNFDGSDQIGRNLSQLSPISICFFQTPTSLPSSCTGSKLWPLKV